MFLGFPGGRKSIKNHFENGLKLRMPKQHPSMAEKLPNVVPKWTQVVAMLAQKSYPPGTAARSDAESKWPPQGGWGAT